MPPLWIRPSHDGAVHDTRFRASYPVPQVHEAHFPALRRGINPRIHGVRPPGAPRYVLCAPPLVDVAAHGEPGADSLQGVAEGGTARGDVGFSFV